ncbi:MAG: S8 family peptidase, partial [Bacteriovoracaceae bacterium]
GPWGMSVTKVYENLPPWMPEEVIVAVIDTGVDYRHEDLKNVMWTNPGEIPGDGIDNDGNGYVDDIYGINTVTRTRFTRKATTDPMAGHWHGTHVAGTIAAEINNGLGIAGIAHNVKIMAIRSVPDSGHESDSSIIESLLYAAKNGAKIINCSFGKPKTQSFAVRDVINSIEALVVAAAGNNSIGPIRWHDIDSKPQYPASFDSPNLLTVTSTTERGELSSFSNIGKISVDIAAPGSNIFSTVNNNKYSSSSGTSMAAPNATGVAAMVLGYFPELSPQELKDLLMKSSKHSKSLEGKIRTPGIINLSNALESASSLNLKESP